MNVYDNGTVRASTPTEDSMSSQVLGGGRLSITL